MRPARSTHVLLIDPQNDFCDMAEAELPAAGAACPPYRPALPVAGADADMKRFAAWLDRCGDGVAAIHVTLDAHHPVDIAHPAWWRDERGDAPPPFTTIDTAALAAGRWRTRDPRTQERSAAYVRALADGGRYRLTVWPEHCLIGSWGHAVHATVAAALGRWARRRSSQVDFLFKGMNPGTEHYSAIRAEVADPADPATLPNTGLLEALRRAERIVVAGEALSHCVAHSVRDLAEYLGPAEIGKLVLLSDCTSPVPGFEALGRQFLDDLTARGMICRRSTEGSL